jgi:hypothetical protein
MHAWNSQTLTRAESAAEPHRPSKTQQLSQLQIAENFQQFVEGCRRLHIDAALLPTSAGVLLAWSMLSDKTFSNVGGWVCLWMGGCVGVVELWSGSW